MQGDGAGDIAAVIFDIAEIAELTGLPGLVAEVLINLQGAPVLLFGQINIAARLFDHAEIGEPAGHGHALAEFFIDNKDAVRAIVERYLSIVWDSSNIGKAPDIVQMIVNDLGGLRSGQLLFVSDPNQDALVFGVWWPWGDGKTISLRVAPYDKRLSDAEIAELITLLKGWFGR